MQRVVVPALAFLAFVCAHPTFADGHDGWYFGVQASAAAYEVDYTKTVDSTNPQNTGPNAGQAFTGYSSADQITWDGGLLVGFRLGESTFVAVEGDVTTHTGSAATRFGGEGTSDGRNSLGEVWPEDWSLTKDMSYGITFRAGTELPIIGADVYAFAGVRRLNADFETSYIGCLLPQGCQDASELYANTERHDEEFDAAVFGFGIEKELANLSVRADLRVLNHGDSSRVVNFDDARVTVPVRFESGEVGIAVGVLWRP